MIVELERLTIRRLLERSYRLYSGCSAIAFSGDQPITYHQLKEKVQQVAAGLLRHGIKKGDRVAILGENNPHWVVAYLATTYIGAVAVPILPGFPETDTRHIIRNSESVALFVEQKQRAKVEGMDASDLRMIFALENFNAEELEKPTRLLEKTRQLFKREKEPETSGAALLSQAPEPEEQDLAAIIYTSGTTGLSKGVMLTHGNIVFDVSHAIERFPINSSDRFLSILPLSHTFEATGGMLCPLAVGASVFYLKGLPTPQKLLEAMQTVRPTAVLAVPLVIDKIYRKSILPEIQKKALLNRLYAVAFFRKQLHRLAGKKLLQSFGGRLRFFMFGGAALNEDVEVFLRDAGISYSTGYGMTETSPIMTINPFGRVKVGSCGQPIPGIEMSIHEPDPASGIGEIIVRGPIVM